MSIFSKNNKSIVISLLLIITIIITNSCNFINNNQNSNKIDISDNTDASESAVKLPKQIEITIKYQLPEYIYDSKEDLFKDFITYLYDYIYNFHHDKGIPHLQSLGINSAEDAIRICKDWNENDGTGLPLVGKAFSPFFLHNDAGGSFKDQAALEDKYFVGHCFGWDKFRMFLYFLKTFFYHFRIDEGYTIIHSDGTITNPEGSDFFASSYASIIDTAKFFYYDKETLPYYFKNLKHIPELYDKIPGVLKTPFDRTQVIVYDTTLNEGYELPNYFDCYGFKFYDWTEYDDYTGTVDKIDNSFIIKHYHDIPQNTDDKITILLYARVTKVGEFAEELENDFIS